MTKMLVSKATIAVLSDGDHSLEFKNQRLVDFSQSTSALWFGCTPDCIYFFLMDKKQTPCSFAAQGLRLISDVDTIDQSCFSNIEIFLKAEHSSLNFKTDAVVTTTRSILKNNTALNYQGRTQLHVIQSEHNTQIEFGEIRNDQVFIFGSRDITLKNLKTTKGCIFMDSIGEINMDHERTTGDLCCICAIVPKNGCCVPCGHMSSCYECLKKVTNCPICRSNITSKIKVYP